ncbi:MAG: hypothetical protein WCL10_17100 [Novosphingobium sp.]|uniref:hypothetical protein n=1 Tax=Novosphingobium sp. TaxID=1874826 RepID=UPI00301732ED
MIERAAGREPLAALLFGKQSRASAEQIAVHADRTQAFTLLNAENALPGSAELLRDGLTFDLTGLTPTAPVTMPEAVHRVALPKDLTPDTLEAAAFAVGPHLAGAENLMPVVRVAAAIMSALSELEGLEAIVWRPARIVMSPVWFAEAVGIWLAGGPFPAFALTALARCREGLESDGLAFFTGQEFTLQARGGAPDREDSRIAVRLTDWLVAHGRVESAREVVLAGVGAVWLEPDGRGRLNAAAR